MPQKQEKGIIFVYGPRKLKNLKKGAQYADGVWREGLKSGFLPI